jgi:hypothetical protein
LLFGCSAARLFYFAVHLLSDRVSFVWLHVTRFPAAAPQFTTSLCIPAFSISSIFSGISFSQISFYYRPSIDYFRPAMTEVSSTRLYLGNLPRNGMLAPDRPSSLSFGEHRTTMHDRIASLVPRVLWALIPHMLMSNATLGPPFAG